MRQTEGLTECNIEHAKITKTNEIDEKIEKNRAKSLLKSK